MSTPEATQDNFKSIEDDLVDSFRKVHPDYPLIIGNERTMIDGLRALLAAMDGEDETGATDG